MGRALAGPAVLAAAMAACSSSLMPHAEAFVPALHSTASSTSVFHGSGAAAAAEARAAATHTRSRRPASSSSVAIMKVAGAQPQQRDAWLEGGVKTRELFNALSQGEIGKRAFTQALAKRMMSKATGMQQDYELSEEASLAASSSASVGSASDLRCGNGACVWSVVALVASSINRSHVPLTRLRLCARLCTVSPSSGSRRITCTMYDVWRLQQLQLRQYQTAAILYCTVCLTSKSYIHNTSCRLCLYDSYCPERSLVCIPAAVPCHSHDTLHRQQ